MAAAGPPPEFLQDPPRLTNTFAADAALRDAVERRLPSDLHARLLPAWRELGELGARGRERPSAPRPLRRVGPPRGRDPRFARLAGAPSRGRAVGPGRDPVRARPRSLRARPPVRPSRPLRAELRDLHLPSRHDGRRRPHLARARERRSRAARRAAPHQPRPRPALDQRPVDDGAVGRKRRLRDGDGRATRRRGLAALGHEVVHLRRHQRGCADPGPAGGIGGRLGRPLPVPRRATEGGRHAQRHPHPASQGQARHARPAHRRARARGLRGGARRRPRPRCQEDHAPPQHHEAPQRDQRLRHDGAAAAAPARLRAPARRLRVSAGAEGAAPRDAGHAPGRARPCGCSRRCASCSRRARRSRSLPKRWRDSAGRATSRTRGCRSGCATPRCCPSGRARRTS